MTSRPPGGPPVLADEVEGWHRLHPLSPLVRVGRHRVTIGFLVLVLQFADHSQVRGLCLRLAVRGLVSES